LTYDICLLEAKWWRLRGVPSDNTSPHCVIIYEKDFYSPKGNSFPSANTIELFRIRNWLMDIQGRYQWQKMFIWLSIGLVYHYFSHYVIIRHICIRNYFIRTQTIRLVNQYSEQRFYSLGGYYNIPQDLALYLSQHTLQYSRLVIHLQVLYYLYIVAYLYAGTITTTANS